MSLEIQSAADFIVNLVKISKHNSVSEYQLTRFNNAIVQTLKERYCCHWNPELPWRGEGYRCIRINKNLDMLIELAGKSVGLSAKILKLSLPEDLIIWINPNLVSFRIKEYGNICIIYENDLNSKHTLNTKKKNFYCKLKTLVDFIVNC